MRPQKTRAPHTSAFCTMANTPASSTSRSRRNPDSARVSACWFRRLAETIFQRSPRLRDAIANTRDACATRKNAPNQIGPKCVPRERRFQASSYATYRIGRGDCRVAHLNQRGIIDPALQLAGPHRRNGRPALERATPAERSPAHGATPAPSRSIHRGILPSVRQSLHREAFHLHRRFCRHFQNSRH